MVGGMVTVASGKWSHGICIQTVMNIGSQIYISFLVSLGLHPMKWCHLHLGWAFLPQLTKSRTVLRDMSRDLSSR